MAVEGLSRGVGIMRCGGSHVLVLNEGLTHQVREKNGGDRRRQDEYEASARDGGVRPRRAGRHGAALPVPHREPSRAVDV
jgi:hypothetical protein